MDRAGRPRGSCRRQEEAHLEALDLAHVIADKLEEHQAVNIVVLELTELTSFTDFFVICTAESDRQAKTLKELLSEELRHEHVTAPLSTEGEPASGWMLLDYNDGHRSHLFARRPRLLSAGRAVEQGAGGAEDPVGPTQACAPN